MLGKNITAEQFRHTLDLLSDPNAGYTAEAIYSLTDLMGERLEAFAALWPTLPEPRRLSIINWLVETGETNFEFDFGPIIRLALSDSAMDVRLAAIDGAHEDSSIAVINRLNEMARSDPFTEVRAAAASALGMFILRGELGQLPETVSARLQETALMLYNDLDEDLEVRRRALEAIANCGREGVLDMIREAYYADDLLMRVSAVFAMGRTYDEMWTAQVLDELSSDYPEMRYEACRAAGELELRKAVGRLSELAYDDDREVQEMAIWALGEIGGKSARNILSQLAALAAEADDDELVDAIAEAQSAATLAGEDLLPLFDFSEYDGDQDDEEFVSLESYDGFGDDEEDEDDEALLDEDDYVF